MKTAILAILYGTLIPAGAIARERCPDCKEVGLCKPGRRICLPTKQGCAEAEACHTRGRCTYRGPDQRCGADDLSCQASASCAESGRCAPDANGRYCNKMTAEGCAESEWCATIGLCGHADIITTGSIDRCTPTNEGCALALVCQVEGRCIALPGNEYCAPTPDGCSASLACAADGRCEAGDKDCEVSWDGCARSRQCQAFGRCGLRDLGEGLRVCGATEAGCKASETCLTEGNCTAAVNGHCLKEAEALDVATRTANAPPPEEPARPCPDCATMGHCTDRGDGVCLATDEGCERSEYCKNLGLCKASADFRACEPTAFGCAMSTECRTSGACSPPTAGGGLCRITAQGCADSIFCKTLGTCRLVDGRCAK